MQSERWYPTLETLQDGSIIIVSVLISNSVKIKVALLTRLTA